jgi:hypothetical protein
LRTTGGALEIEQNKTDNVVISFERNTKGLIKIVTNTHPYTLYARDYMGIVRPLEQLNSMASRKTLGVYQSPTGNSKDEAKYLLEKVQVWADNVKKSRLNHEDTRKATSTTIGKTLAYPLSATTLTKEQCYKVNLLFLKTALPKSGIVRTAARDLVFSPASVMDFGFPDLWTLQLIEHVMVLIEHGSSNSLTGKLLRNIIEGHYIEVGLGGDVFQWDIENIPWITKTWFSETVRDLSMVNINIRHDIIQPYAWKASDVFIMEKIWNTKLFTTHQIRIINEVRMFHQVILLSDICTADGLQIKKEILSTTKTWSCSSRAYHWPNTVPPTRQMMELWIESLQQAFGLNENGSFLQPYNDYFLPTIKPFWK